MKKILIALLCSTSLLQAQAQNTRIGFGLEGLAGYTSNDRVPFWIRSNQFGSIPLSGPSASLIASARVAYDTSRARLFDWGASVQVRGNAGKGSYLTLVEGYGKLRLGIFQLQGGRIKEVMGISDTLLTSGNYSISGNALGIPKIQLSIPEYYTIPILGRFVAFKGNYAHGWVGKTPVQYGDTNMTTTQFHQKSLYLRLGKPSWRVKLHGGFNHQVFFGDERNIWSKEKYHQWGFQLTDWDTYQHVIFGKVWSYSKVGNHLGSIDLALEYDFSKIKLLLYRQTFYEVGGLAHLSNLRDGLHGLSLTNKHNGVGKVRWNKLLFEVLYTKNQGGEAWSKMTPSGDEDYYNNYLYTEGWSYKQVGLGNPLITSFNDMRSNLPRYPWDYFTNNRVIAFHVGFIGSIGKLGVLSRLTYSTNYGTFGTSTIGHTTGLEHSLPIYGIFTATRQFSGILELSREFENNVKVTGVAAIDQGKLLYNTVGLQLRLSKQF